MGEGQSGIASLSGPAAMPTSKPTTTSPADAASRSPSVLQRWFYQSVPAADLAPLEAAAVGTQSDAATGMQGDMMGKDNTTGDRMPTSPGLPLGSTFAAGLAAAAASTPRPSVKIAGLFSREAAPAGRRLTVDISTPTTSSQGLDGAPSATPPYYGAAASLLTGWRSASKGGPTSNAVGIEVESDSKIKGGAFPDIEKATGGKGDVAAAADAGAPKKKPPSTFSVFSREFINIVCAAVSVAAAISAYLQLLFAATDVQSVIASYQVTPIKTVMLVPRGTPCPSNFTTLSTLSWPGAASLGCGCPAGASYQGISYSSSASSACNPLQLRAGCVVNTPTGLAAMQLASFRASTICYQRGLASYVQTAEPSAAGACGPGYHKCGSANGTYTSDRSQCVPDSTGTGCPLTWLGTDFFFSQVLKDVSPLLAPSLKLPVVKYASGTQLHVQTQSRQVVRLQTPIIDMVTTLQQSAANRGPCYKGVSQTYVGKSAGLPGYPAPCTSVDSRWVPFDLYSEADLLGENFVASGQFATRCGSFATLTEAIEANFWSNGLRCNNTAKATDLRCESGLDPGAVTCDAADKTCQDTFYQSRCGHLIDTVIAAKKMVGIYMRPQTYWKRTCPYSPADVRGTEDPISASIAAQYALLVINCIVNGLQAVISLYIVFEALCRMEGQPDKVKDSWVPRVAKIGQMCKLPVIVASIVCISTIYRFYRTLSSGQCSDSITNESFDSLGSSLPGVLHSNIATLVSDSSQLIVIPLLLAGWRKYKHPNERQLWAPDWLGCRGKGEREGRDDPEEHVRVGTAESVGIEPLKI